MADDAPTPPPAGVSGDPALAAKLYPQGAENPTGGGTGQSTSGGASSPAPAAAEPEAPAAPPVAAKDASAPGEGEPKPEGDKAGEGASSTPLTVESYSALALPEGMELNDGLMTDFKTLAASKGIPPEAAQDLMNLYGRAAQEQVNAVAKAWNDTQTAWTSALNAMPEFQGERRAQTDAVLGKVIEEFTASPEAAAELRQAFNSSGMGNNPHLVRMILDMATALVEDEPPLPGNPPAQSRRGRSLGEVLYPTPAPN